MKKYQVLIIEDDEQTVQKLSKIISKEGFDVISANDGKSGLELFKKETPEIVITDLVMPEIEGMEVMKKIKSSSSKTQVIIMTAYGESETAIKALQDGALDYIKKPIDIDDLILAIGRAREKVISIEKSMPFPIILFADDDDTARKRFCKELGKEGWDVFPAEDGVEALQVFKNNKIDVVVTDIKMPQKDGLQLLHEMRELSDDFEAIILTGYGDEGSAIQAMRDGAINFLKKPVDLDQLILSIEKALEKLSLSRALKFRLRELELAQTIITQITNGKEIIVNLNESVSISAQQYAMKLIDELTLCICVLSENYEILFMNQHLSNKIKKDFKSFDKNFVNSLGEFNNVSLDYDKILESLKQCFVSPSGTIINFEINQNLYITFIQVTILTNDDNKKMVFCAINYK